MGKKKRETMEEYRERMKRFNAAKASFEYHETGLGRFLPDAPERRQQANAAMWENCNGPARTE